MSKNLIKQNDVWDDTELVKMYNESCKTIMNALISKAKLDVSVENEDSIEDSMVDDLSDKEIGEIDHDKEDGEMDEEEGEEEGEIRECLIANSRKRPIVDDTQNEADNKNEEGQMTSDEEGEMSTKKFKSNSTSPASQNDHFDDINIEQQQQQQPQQQNDKNSVEHPGILSNSLINEHIQSTNNVINNTTIDIKATLKATLGSYWQAGYHIKNLENLLNIEQGSLQVPLPCIVDSNNVPTELNSKLNAALLSYWQMGYYGSSCEMAFSHKE